MEIINVNAYLGPYTLHPQHDASDKWKGMGIWQKEADASVRNKEE